MTTSYQQAVLDGQDAILALERLARLRLIHDTACDEVARLTHQLAAAKRRLKEAGWNLAAAERTLAGVAFIIGADREPPIPALPAPKAKREKGGA